MRRSLKGEKRDGEKLCSALPLLLQNMRIAKTTPDAERQYSDCSLLIWKSISTFYKYYEFNFLAREKVRITVPKPIQTRKTKSNVFGPFQRITQEIWMYEICSTIYLELVAGYSHFFPYSPHYSFILRSRILQNYLHNFIFEFPKVQLSRELTPK